MNKCIDKICPYCRTEIGENDDVIICPSCGIPHHKACWEENKGCTTFGCKEQHYEEQHTNPTDVCANCGTPLGDGQMFCPKCGAARGTHKENVCSKCGAELWEGQEFCPKCGQKIGLSVDTRVDSAISQFNARVEKGHKKKVFVPIIVGAVAVAAIGIFFLLKGPAVEEIVLAKSSLELKVDDFTTVSYTISPDKASVAKVTWESSDKSVATVTEDGEIVAKGDGSCIITVSAGSKSDSLRITVRSGPDFQKIFDDCKLDKQWASVASDGSYLSVDTNPHDYDDHMEYDAFLSLYLINKKLGLPDSLMDEVAHTSSLDGRQSETFENAGVTVTWKYHPDQGLEISYKAMH